MLVFREAAIDPLQLVADLPSNSKTRVGLTNALIDELWNSLEHPPLNYLGPKYIYRSADGSNNVSVTALTIVCISSSSESLLPDARSRQYTLCAKRSASNNPASRSA